MHRVTSYLNVATGTFSRNLFVVGKSNKFQNLQHTYLNCGNNKDSKVANVATGTFWLESADLRKKQKAF
jgi:hypothetical protein